MHERPGEPMIRLAIVDDHRILSDLLMSARPEELRTQDGRGIRLVGSAARLSEIPMLLRRGTADVALVDYLLPDGRGPMAIDRMKQVWPKVKAVIFTGQDLEEVADDAVLGGADGLLSKGGGMDDLLRIIGRAADGEVLFEPSFIKALSERSQRSLPQRADPASLGLTPREQSVLEAVLATGDPARAAERLQISLPTLRVHLHNLALKFGSSSTLETITMALRAGVLRPPMVMHEGSGTLRN